MMSWRNRSTSAMRRSPNRACATNSGPRLRYTVAWQTLAQWASSSALNRCGSSPTIDLGLEAGTQVRGAGLLAVGHVRLRVDHELAKAADLGDRRGISKATHGRVPNHRCGDPANPQLTARRCEILGLSSSGPVCELEPVALLVI